MQSNEHLEFGSLKYVRGTRHQLKLMTCNLVLFILIKQIGNLTPVHEHTGRTGNRQEKHKTGQSRHHQITEVHLRLVSAGILTVPRTLPGRLSSSAPFTGPTT